MESSKQKDSGNISIIYSTFPNYESACGVCGTLLEEGLIACANVLQGVSSIYRWEGEIRKSAECAVILKTMQYLEEQTILRIEELHPYTTPAIFSIPISRCSDNFLDWIRSLPEKCVNN